MFFFFFFYPIFINSNWPFFTYQLQSYFAHLITSDFPQCFIYIYIHTYIYKKNLQLASSLASKGINGVTSTDLSLCVQRMAGCSEDSYPGCDSSGNLPCMQLLTFYPCLYSSEIGDKIIKVYIFNCTN